MRAALFAVAALALVAGALAYDDTKGTTLRGFTFSSNVGEYLAISQDICDIRKMLNKQEPPYADAQAIYMDGKNAKTSTGKVLSMRELATQKQVDLPFWKLYTKHFKTPVWIDDVVQRAFQGLAPFKAPVQRVQLIVKGLESGLQVATLMTALDRAAAALKAGKKDDALQALDQGWAIFVGGNTDCGLWTVTMKRANEYGTKVNCESSGSSDKILKAFLKAQAAIKAGDQKGVEAAIKDVQAAIFATFTQATVTYAHEMYLDKEAGLPADEHQVEAYAFYRTIAPLVAAGNSTASEALDFFLFPGQPVPAKDIDLVSLRALGTAYEFNGITPKDVGQYGRKQPELGCKAYVAKASEQGGLLSSTAAKDSLRPTEGAAAAAPADGAAAPAAAAPAPKAGTRRFLF
ncbi:hypothetical protein Rsub_04896 [Raphidocelis subcapitata]|uniref:Uncharacterized protein n=1 Tax=Raphidocelis subcapitata TaxID=307507 RepID=A0A2V0NVY2_9CHLO|nr:hypothetical protein Rsub_04896 [Raphidocelis subcapitata]|eukprot:GBF91791.1 hypothetical protein Rsub_04896 [Raphidocelis subcapitata]